MIRHKKQKKGKKKKTKPRNALLAHILKTNHRSLRNRVVKPKRGKGRKSRPRKKDWAGVDSNGQSD